MNEADDQYAIVHALLSPRFDIKGFVAAHFGFKKSPHTMLDSYEELENIFSIMQIPTEQMIYHGAPKALDDILTPIVSEGSQRIIQEAHAKDDRPLFILCQGPLTNIASAYLQDPSICEKLTIIWIGGATYPNGGPEPNLATDIHSAQVIFDSPIPLWQIPRNVYMEMRVSFADLEIHVLPFGKIGKYLFDEMNAYANKPPARRNGESWILGDNAGIEPLLCDETYDYKLIKAPSIGDDMQYVHEKQNREIRVYTSIDRAFILSDFYAKLRLASLQSK
jgi:inosine-uridine nucleoside N-ribohydrolase